MLACYRCFKEIRNVSAHAGRTPDINAVTAYTNASPLTAGLGLNGRNLALPTVVAGNAVQLSLLHIQALCGLLLKIVITLDAELAITQAAEGVLVDRWKESYSYASVSADPVRRKRRIAYMNSRVGLPALNDTEALYQLLRNVRAIM